MQCTNPVLVPNKSRFFDSSTSHPLLVYGRCGKCVNCQQNKSAEWYFRAYKHFEDCVNRGGFVQFVTLSYSNKFLPKLRDFAEFSCLNPSEDMSCFDSSDLALFHSNLRSRLRRMGFDKGAYSYFICSEYGHDNLYVDGRGRVRRGTNRPHYHALFYVYADINPLEFSYAVQKSWHFGLTDGIGDDVNNKLPAYVMNNTFYSLAVGGRKVVGYVSKYVQKSLEFSKRVELRVMKVLHRVSAGDPFFLKSESGKRLRRRLFDLARQFHRQSAGFGASALNDVDFTELYKVGSFVIRDSSGNMSRFPISQYYHRKICYDKVWHDGAYMWSLKEKALPLIELRKSFIFKSLVNHYKVILPELNFSSEVASDLADYVLNYKGRNRAPFDEPLLLGDLLDSADRFVYNSVGGAIVSDTYLGNLSGRVCGIDFNVKVERLHDYIETNTFTDSDSPRWCVRSSSCLPARHLKVVGFDRLLRDIAEFETAIDSSYDVESIKQTLFNKYKSHNLIT